MKRAQKPHRGQFQPGNKAAVGNPGPGKRDFLTQVLISQLHEVDRSTGREKLHLLVERMLALALGFEFQVGRKKYQFPPDGRMIKEVWDRVEGKAVQAVGVEQGSGKITIVFEEPGDERP